MSRAEFVRTVGGLRRRMPRHLFSAFCLSLLLLGCACGPAYAEDGVPEDSVTLFKACDRDLHGELCDEVSPRDVKYFALPFLVGGDGVMVAFAEARYTKSDEKSVDIVARYIETEGQDWASRAIEKNGGNWKTQLVLQGKDGDSALNNPTAVMKDNKIYLLALTNWRNKSSQNDNGWHFELSVGAIRGEVGSKMIEWGPSESLHSKLTQEVEKMHLKVFSGSSHFAFLTSKGTILFSVSATNREGAKGNAILQLKDDKEQWKVSFVENPKECRLFSLFEWKERLVSVFFGCSTGTNYAKEYDEVKKEWKNADDRLLHMWSNDHAPSDLYPVTIGNKTALLFLDEQSSGGVSQTSLWYTDGNRMGDAGLLYAAPYTDLTYGFYFYTNGELFIMCQDISKGLGAIFLTRLNHELSDIKSTLKTWATNDAYLSKPCSETASEGASHDTLCVTPMPTDGLVGFLSDGDEHPYWNDEYQFRDAEVKGGRKVKNGYTFRGADSGAQLRLGDTGFGKRYDFTKYGLTIVATVAVHETPKGDAPLLTVDGVGSYERLGLWYKDNQWKVVSKNDKEEPAMDLKPQKEHRVALILQKSTISVYVDGKSRGSPLPISAFGNGLFSITNIFIGTPDYGSGIKMTVTDVFLYSRVLNDTELKAASKRVPPVTPTDSEKTDERKTDSENVSETPAEPPETPKTPTNPEDGSVCVHMSITSLFLLGCLCLAIFR